MVNYLRPCSAQTPPKIVKCLGPYSAQTPASPKLSSPSGPALPRFPPSRDCQLPRTLLNADSRLPRLTAASGPTLLRLAPSQDCQLPRTLLCTDSRLPETASDAHSLLSYNLVVEYEQLSAPTERLPPPRLSMNSIVPNFPILRPLAPQPWLGF